MQRFHDKFETYPVIRHRKNAKGEWSYVLQVESPSGKFDYYWMGDTVNGAFWYIDNLKKIPVGTITFDDVEAVQQFKKEQQRKKDAKNN